jgi:hypothetical protein
VSIWTAAWLGWGAIFGVVEYLALKRRDAKRRPDTLSEHVWAFQKAHPLLRVAFLGFWGWLTIHFIFGGH